MERAEEESEAPMPEAPPMAELTEAEAELPPTTTAEVAEVKEAPAPVAEEACEPLRKASQHVHRKTQGVERFCQDIRAGLKT